jgi:hypothetical protein
MQVEAAQVSATTSSTFRNTENIELERELELHQAALNLKRAEETLSLPNC